MLKKHNLFSYKLIIFIAFLAVSFVSCTKEDEESTPVDGTTITGEWKCNDSESENGIYGAQSFIIDISKNTTDYTIANFGNLGINTEVNAEISGSNITVNEQTVDDIIVHGSGTFTNNNKTVNFTYFLDDEKVESVWSKN